MYKKSEEPEKNTEKEPCDETAEEDENRPHWWQCFLSPTLERAPLAVGFFHLLLTYTDSLAHTDSLTHTD